MANKDETDIQSPVKEEPPLLNSSSTKKTNNSASANKTGKPKPKPKSCHQCHHNDKPLVLECTKCHSKRYCLHCITKWYPALSIDEFLKACPFCCNNCNCKECLRRLSPKVKPYSCSQQDKINFSKQILQTVFPLVTTLNQHQLIHKEIEANLKGVSISELQLQDADCDVDDDIFCDNCASYCFDFYRSCACGYDLCLLCCQELRDGQLKGIINYGWKAHMDGSIPCPPKNIGGCNGGTLALKRIIHANWIANLLQKAQGVNKINYSYYDDPQTSIEFDASYVCSMSAKDLQPQHMQQRFQFHWSKGEPVIVNDVLSTSSGLSWEPMVLWRAFRDIITSSNNSLAYEVRAINCLDWSEVTIDLGKFCSGYSAGQFTSILKLEDWKPSCLSQGQWPRHFVEFINCLPFKDYTNPDNGYLNLAVKLPDQSLKPDMGPKMDIAYGVEEELEYGNSVTKLHYEKSDTVNVLTHSKSGVLTSKKRKKTKIVKQSYGGDQHEALVCEMGPQRTEDQQHVDNLVEAGALWDIFQRQDVPKLEEYLRNCSAEFRHTNYGLLDCQLFHPIHDHIFYLNTKHKRKLKEEFGIEPWTFKQKLGDAVFIPAGCPYQVRNLKSNTKVELNFLSPESLGECMRLQKELRDLPNNHRAKRQNINIGKMMIYALDDAVTNLSRFIDSNRPTDDLQDQFTKAPENLNACDENHTNGWVCDSESEDDSHDTSNVLPALSPSDSDHHTPDNQPSTSEEEAVGLWHGNAVGRAAKEILQAVEDCYPETFQGLQIRSKPHWLSILKELHLFIKGFLETSVNALAEDQISSLEADLNDFERLGFNLSWARKRLDMVKNLNDPLRLELVGLEESLSLLYKEMVDANARLAKARLDYDRARDARNKKADEVAHKFGPEFYDVLNGNLGFGMLPGY